MRTGPYSSGMMKGKYGIPQIQVVAYGVKGCSKDLRYSSSLTTKWQNALEGLNGFCSSVLV